MYKPFWQIINNSEYLSIIVWMFIASLLFKFTLGNMIKELWWLDTIFMPIFWILIVILPTFIFGLKNKPSMSWSQILFKIPPILILIQLGVLIYLYSSHANFFEKSASNLPSEFDLFKSISTTMIIFQIAVWFYLIVNVSLKGNPMKSIIYPAFTLGFILSGIVLSQMWVILNLLKCDC